MYDGRDPAMRQGRIPKQERENIACIMKRTNSELLVVVKRPRTSVRWISGWTHRPGRCGNILGEGCKVLP